MARRKAKAALHASNRAMLAIAHLALSEIDEGTFADPLGGIGTEWLVTAKSSVHALLQFGEQPKTKEASDG